MGSTGTALMAKPKGRPRKPGKLDDVSIRIERSLATMVRGIADYQGRPAVEVLSELAREPVRRAYAQMMRELEGDDR